MNKICMPLHFYGAYTLVDEIYNIQSVYDHNLKAEETGAVTENTKERGTYFRWGNQERSP